MTGTLIVSSRSTSIKSIVLSARQAKHCMTAAVSLPAQTGARPSDALGERGREAPQQTDRPQSESGSSEDRCLDEGGRDAPQQTCGSCGTSSSREPSGTC